MPASLGRPEGKAVAHTVWGGAGDDGATVGDLSALFEQAVIALTLAVHLDKDRTIRLGTRLGGAEFVPAVFRRNLLTPKFRRRAKDVHQRFQSSSPSGATSSPRLNPPC